MSAHVMRLFPGCYRVRTEDGRYRATVKREGREWCARIQNDDGATIRFAGLWPTKRDAVEEAARVLHQMNR